jgi:hypothetical protein
MACDFMTRIIPNPLKTEKNIGDTFGVFFPSPNDMTQIA